MPAQAAQRGLLENLLRLQKNRSRALAVQEEGDAARHALHLNAVGARWQGVEHGGAGVDFWLVADTHCEHGPGRVHPHRGAHAPRQHHHQHRAPLVGGLLAAGILDAVAPLAARHHQLHAMLVAPVQLERFGLNGWVGGEHQAVTPRPQAIEGERFSWPHARPPHEALLAVVLHQQAHLQRLLGTVYLPLDATLAGWSREGQEHLAVIYVNIIGFHPCAHNLGAITPRRQPTNPCGSRGVHLRVGHEVALRRAAHDHRVASAAFDSHGHRARPVAGWLALGPRGPLFDLLDDGQMSARPAFRVPGIVFPCQVTVAQKLVGQEPGAVAEVIVGGVGHVDEAEEVITGVQIGVDGRVAQVLGAPHHSAPLGGQHGHLEAENFHEEVPVRAVLEEAVAVLAQRAAGRAPLTAPPVDHVEGFAEVVAFPLFGGERLAVLVDRVVGIIGRVVEKVVVDGQPSPGLKEVSTAALGHVAQGPAHEVYVVPVAAGRGGWKGRQATLLQDVLGVGNPVFGHDFGQPLPGRLPLTRAPLLPQVGLVVDLEVDGAGRQQALHPLLEFSIQATGIRLVAVEAHNGHHVVGPQLFHQPFSAVVQALDPFDVHGEEFGEPAPANFVQGNSGHRTG